MRGSSVAVIGVAAAALMVAAGYFIQPSEPDVAPYAPADVLHAIEAMNSFVHISEDRHVIIDDAKAASEPGVTELDVEIARDLAIHIDKIVDSQSGQTEYNPELFDAVHHFENGRFAAIFAEDSAESKEAADTLLVAILHILGVLGATDEPPG